MTKEVKRYFNIFECGSNILDRLDVTYQRAFMDTPQDKYYTEMLENLVKMNNCNGELLCNEELPQAASDVREETDAENEHNINDITCDDLYQSPMKKKDESIINSSVYYELDKQVHTISDSNKKIDPRRDTMT